MPKITETDVHTHRKMRTEEILDTVEEMLAHQGDEQLSIARIARQMGLTRTAVYKYFPSMDAVLEAVVGRYFPAWHAHIVEAVNQQNTPHSRIVAYIQANIDQATTGDHAWRAGLSRVSLGAEARQRIAIEHRKLAQLLHDEVASLDDDSSDGHNENLAAALEALTNAAVNRIDAGADPTHTTEFFCGLAHKILN